MSLVVHPHVKQFERDRWHCAIIIQLAIRRALARMRVNRITNARSTWYERLYHDADRTEAAIRIQCAARQFLARRNVQRCRWAKQGRTQQILEVLALPELFSIADLPKELFHWDDLMRDERRFTHHGPLSTQYDPTLVEDRIQRVIALRSQPTEPGEGLLYPHPASTAFVQRALDIFRRIDVRERHVIDERYLIEIHDLLGAPVPSGVQYGCGSAVEDPHREGYCRQLLLKILQHSGRRVGSGSGGDECLQRGALNLNFDEFCTFLAVLAQQ